MLTHSTCFKHILAPFEKEDGHHIRFWHFYLIFPHTISSSCSVIPTILNLSGENCFKMLLDKNVFGVCVCVSRLLKLG